MNNPAFSIIIPLYNKEKTIESTLRSCLNQTYKNYEIIVVDDGSTDKSLNIAENIDNSKLRIARQKNSGVSAARNRGIREAKNEWIYMLDADDILLPQALEIMAELIRREPSARLIMGEGVYTYSDKDISKNIEVQQSISSIHSCWFDYKQYWKDRFTPSAGNNAIHKSVFEQYKYNELASYYEDHLLYLNIMRQFKWLYTPAPVYIYMMGNAGLSKNPHPIEKEGAYYMSNEKFSSVYEALSFLRIFDCCCRFREMVGDKDGASYYNELRKRIFPFYVRFIFSALKEWRKIKQKIV